MAPCEGHRWVQILTIPALAAAIVLGCSPGHDRSAQSAPPAPPAASTSTTSAAPAANGSVASVTPATLTLADLDVYEKGAKARIAFLMQVKKDLDAAKTSQDSIRAVTRMGSEEPDSDVAHAAGISLGHEQDVTRAFGDIIGTLHQQEIGSLDAQVDTAHMDAASLAQVRPMIVQDRQRRDSTTKAVMASMAPDVAAAFQQRRANLDSLTFQTMKIFADTKKS